MISVVMYSHQSSGICTATIIFYTCILIPLHQIKQTLFSILVLPLMSSSSSSSSRLEPAEIEYRCRKPQQQQLLPVLPCCRFKEIEKKKKKKKDEELSSCCSICLMELEKEDEVSQLSRCMHIFHVDCIDKWIERHHFTCPLCRTSIPLFHF